MNRELLALLIHDIKNQLGVLEAELASLEAQPHQALAHKAHQHCSQLRQRLVAYLTVYGSSDKQLRAHAEDESPGDFLHSLLKVDSRPDGAPLRVVDSGTMPPFWYFDARLVRLALEAALHNAWRFARSEVLISCTQHEQWLIFAIEDDGPGLGSIDPQARSSTGLGMELCSAVARAHRLQDRCGKALLLPRPGGGTRFELQLP